MTRSLILTLLAAAAIAGGTWAHGAIRHRWGVSQKMETLAAALEDVPRTFGDWELREEQEIDPEVSKMLECAGHCHRVYLNRTTGAVVNVAVLLGPAGPISVHTPAICYRGSDYKQLGVQPIEVGEDKLSVLSLQSPDVTSNRLHVSYAWRRPTGNWATAKSPRFTFAFYPYLYKIQTAAPGGVLEDGSEDLSTTRDFLSAFLPALERRGLGNDEEHRD